MHAARDPAFDFVVRAQGGDGRAFEHLVRLHRQRIYAASLRILGSHADAEDATQNVLIRTWTSLGQLRDATTFAAWLNSITRRTCLEHLRSRRIHVPLDQAPPSVVPPHTHPDAVFESRLHIEALLRATKELSKEQLEVFYLRQVENRSYEQIATTLNISRAAARSRWHRARVQLTTAVYEMSAGHPSSS